MSLTKLKKPVRNLDLRDVSSSVLVVMFFYIIIILFSCVRDILLLTFQYKFLKGCIDCPNAIMGCENLKKRMEADFNLTLLTCHVTCCEKDKCNTMEPIPPTKPPNSASPLTAQKEGLVAVVLGCVVVFLTLT